MNPGKLFVQTNTPGRRWLTKGERDRLLHIAALLEAEAQTWREGFAWKLGVEWEWPKEHEWAHARAFKLQQAAEFIREFVAKSPTEAKTA